MVRVLECLGCRQGVEGVGLRGLWLRVWAAVFQGWLEVSLNG